MRENEIKRFEGHIVDVVGKRIFKGTVKIRDGKIEQVREAENKSTGYILPGLIDAHIHIESSMLIPSEFARLAVVHGTVATVSDPHEIANVLGIPGIRFMIGNGKKTPFKFYFGASSCVPATAFETSGASIGPEELEELLKEDDIHYLSEMMNFPGVLYNDPTVMSKLAVAKKYNKPIDGHAPGLRGEQAAAYIRAGISTDHECFTKEEALDKIHAGMKIQIREGSAAKNFEALSDLIEEYPERVMLCSDDRHPNDLVAGHIDSLVRRALARGYDIMKVFRSCTLNPVRHYSLDVGLLQPGDPADFIMVDNLDDFRVLGTWINGTRVAENGKSLLEHVTETAMNRFHASPVTMEEIRVEDRGQKIRVQEAYDGQLITGEVDLQPLNRNGMIIPDVARDILKIVVKNRYTDGKPAVGFVKGFGLKEGAIASCVAHDSHNIIAVGTDDAAIVSAIHAIVDKKGGISLAGKKQQMVLPLQVAGIMSGQDGYEVAALYDAMDRQAKAMGSPLHAPFMTLSFMALLVIPELKLSDRGLFDGRKFAFTGLYTG
jgi:adenine deaminase